MTSPFATARSVRFARLRAIALTCLLAPLAACGSLQQHVTATERAGPPRVIERDLGGRSAAPPAGQPVARR